MLYTSVITISLAMIMLLVGLGGFLRSEISVEQYIELLLKKEDDEDVTASFRQRRQREKYWIGIVLFSLIALVLGFVFLAGAYIPDSAPKKDQSKKSQTIHLVQKET